MKIELKFDEQFKEKMLAGEKTCTTRKEQKGKKGDTFTVFGERFIIIDTANVNFGHIMDNWWDKEGFTSKKEFVEFMLKCYGEVDIRKKYCIHWFERCDTYLDYLLGRKSKLQEQTKSIDSQIAICEESKK